MVDGVSLELQPLDLKEANELVRTLHRHHKPVPGSKFAIGVAIDGRVCGAIICGRPIARMEDQDWTIEAYRCVTDGTKNACSMLYRAAWRAAKNMGYRRLITFTLPEEGGASLRAAAFKCLGEAGGGKWSCKSRPRVDLHPLQVKMKWELTG